MDKKKTLLRIKTMDDILELAKQYAGNHKRFESFIWVEEPEDSENYALILLRTRDSNLLEQSNADFIEKTLKPYGVKIEHFNHWAVGWVDNLVLKVFDNNVVTEAFEKFVEIKQQFEDYPALDEDDYIQRVYDATIENIQKEGYDEDTAKKVYKWLFDNMQEEITEIDGFGGYPSEESIKQALLALEV
jgi:hypothetical protein